MIPIKQHSDIWTLRDNVTLAIKPWAVMGIVNLTPDSFYDQSRRPHAKDGLNHAKTLWYEGAQILDLGAESSRPGAEPISADEELQRLMPVLLPLMDEVRQAKNKTMQGQSSPCVLSSNTFDSIKNPYNTALMPPIIEHVPYISVDTYHAKTAKEALDAGVHIINDISACTFEPELLEVVCHYKPGYVLMHSSARPRVMQEQICHGNIVDNLRLFFELHLQKLICAGMPESNIVLDLGIGFGKSFEQNMELLLNISKFHQLGFPILVGISMKSFLSNLLGLEKNDFSLRSQATQNITNLLALRGFGLHRVHDVAKTVATLRLVEAFKPKYFDFRV